MEEPIELEICANCKKEIPQFNYVMHTAHCARNITLCPVCKEPIPKNKFEEHRKTHKTGAAVVPERKSHVRKIEETDFPRQISKTVTTSTPPKAREAKPPGAAATSKNLGATPKRVETADRKSNGFSLKEPASKLKARRENAHVEEESPAAKATERKSTREANVEYTPPKAKDELLACRYCDLELHKLELEDHENYCGSRTDKCNACGELVMFKYKKLHEESNHGFLKLKDEPGPRASWDSDTQRATETTPMRRDRPAPIYTVNSFDFSPLYRSYSNDYSLPLDDKKETYKDISRRLDCQAPAPPQRRPNPPAELTIPCEFCNTPIPHEDLIQHETGCRPDLARLKPKRRSPSPADDYYDEPPQSPEVELPCEFCSDMFPASQLLRHQLSCN